MTASNAPIVYISNFISNPEIVFSHLRDELNWERRDTTPRSEYYCNDVQKPYLYGKGRGQRTYYPQPYHPLIDEMRSSLKEKFDCHFEVCFLNRYLDQSDHLFWHADDSPEMDDAKPIAVVSLGVEREIWFRSNVNPAVVEKLKLQNGSVCLMLPGMQDTWQHRIPKASFQCGERISLTFRGWLDPA